MSLIAWYPLNGDTRDYSGNELHLTNNGATVDIDGKIGLCYLTNHKSNKTLNVTSSIITNALSNGNDFTICFWQKIASLQPAMNIACGNTSSANKMLHIGIRSATTVSMGFYSDDLNGDYSFSENKWYHITAVYQKGYQKIYVNGQLINSRKSKNNLVVNGKFEIGRYSNETVDSFYNDVRIYNEALTAKQIKEISQAKICHYTFNENIQPVKNLCKQYPVKKYSVSGYSGTEFGKDDIGDYFIKQSTSYKWDGIYVNIPIQTGKYYTVSYEIWCEKAFNVMYDFNIVCKNISGNDAPRAESANLLGTTYDTPKRWKKFAMRSKAKDEAIEPKLQDTIAGYMVSNKDMVGTKIYYRNVMVEEKDRETTYIEDSKSIVLKDVTGFNDLNITETQTHSFPTYKEDSFKFSTYSQIVTNIKLSTSNIGGDSQLTTVSWIKPTVIPAENSLGLIYGRGDYQGFGLCFGYHNSSHIAIRTYHRLSDNVAVTANKAIKLNEWIQVACVLDNINSKIKLYVNGEKIDEAASSTGAYTRAQNKFMFGGKHNPWGDGPWSIYEGHIKDFRMYATALSDKDIKLLYQPEINIDKSSVIRCYEINEEKINDNKIGFYKNASIAYNEFNEVPNIKSGVHNLKLGNEILPVLIDVDKDDGRWARVFYHNCRSGTVLFSKDNSYAEAKETNKTTPTDVDKYSILSKLESFRPNTKSAFEFKLKYPTNTNDYNIWKQTSNPTYESISGYVPIQISWTTNLWGGLEYNGSSTFIDGSVNHSNWYYAIGVSSKYSDGMPMFNGSTAHDVELWIRINNYDLFSDSLINNVSISRDGVLIAKEFREI